MHVLQTWGLFKKRRSTKGEKSSLDGDKEAAEMFDTEIYTREKTTGSI